MISIFAVAGLAVVALSLFALAAAAVLRDRRAGREWVGTWPPVATGRRPYDTGDTND